MLLSAIELGTYVTWKVAKWSITKMYDLTIYSIYGHIPTEKEILEQRIKQLEDNVDNLEKEISNQEINQEINQDCTKQTITYM